MRVQVFTVSHFTRVWIKLVVRSFQKFFPAETLLVIDNNPDNGNPKCEQERLWLRQQAGVCVIPNNGRRTHGGGIEKALEWGRCHDMDVMIHIEPDCLISGSIWRQSLIKGIERGAWYVGSHKKQYGPIHPAPCALATAPSWGTFDAVRKTQDEVRHPRFLELYKVEALKNAPWHLTHWDTAQRNWFFAAVNDRALLVEAPDFSHLWKSSMREPTGAEKKLYEAVLGGDCMDELLGE
jgi:hypothetical protein